MFQSNIQLCVCSFSEILKHEELEGKIKTACLGSLLLQDDLTRLEEQYLTHTEVTRPADSWVPV